MRLRHALGPVLVGVLSLAGAAGLTTGPATTAKPVAVARQVPAVLPAPVPAQPAASTPAAEVGFTLGAAPDAPTHVDPAPAGVDVAREVSTAELTARSRRSQRAAGAAQDPLRAGLLAHTPGAAGSLTAAAAAPAGTPVVPGLTSHTPASCTGTGTDGKRVQVVYAVEQGATDRFADPALKAVLRQEVANVDDTFAVSARKTGGGRLVRWVSDAACSPILAHAVLPAGSLGSSFDATRSALIAAGFNDPNRKYLVFADAHVICGVGAIFLDSSTAASNRNNGGNMHARIDTGCWVASARSGSVAAHELMHTLGGVQPAAPHGTEYGHCTDDGDLMCYADGTTKAITQTCSTTVESLFDCNDDDYFHTAPSAGSYLATHWNTAASSFLDVTSAASATSSVSSVQTGVSFSVTATGPAGAAYAWALPSDCTAETPVDRATVRVWCDKDQPSRGSAVFTAQVTSGRGTTSVTARVLTQLAATPAANLRTTPTAPTNGAAFTVTATPVGQAPFSYAWTTASTCLTSGTTAASITFTCPADLTTRSIPLDAVVTQRDGQSVAVHTDLTSSPAPGPTPRVTIGGPAQLRPGLGQDFTAASSVAGVGWRWTLDAGKAACAIGSTSGATVRIQCPATMTGTLTLTATATATAGAASGQGVIQIVLGGAASPLTTALTSDTAAAFVGRDVVLTATICSGTRPVRSTATIEASTDGTTWTTVLAATDAGPSGTLTLTQRPAVRTTYRLTVQPTAGWTNAPVSTTVMVSPVHTALTVTAAQGAVGAPSALTVSLRDSAGAALAGRQLVLQVRPIGQRWTTLPRTYRTTAQPLRVFVSPDRQTSYRFVFAGGVDVDPATSEVVTLSPSRP